MTTLQELEQALIKADVEGDVVSARVLAAGIQRMRSATEPGVVKSAAMGVARGLKDALDSGAYLLASGFDKLAGTQEGERVRQMNEAGKADFEREYGNNKAAQRGREAGYGVVTVPVGVARGVKDVIDTGAYGLSSAFDMVAGTQEGQRIKQMNDAGKADFEREYGDSTAAQIGRVGGNIVATLPMGGGLGTLVQAGGNALKVSKFVSPVAEAIASGGMRASGLSTIPGLAARSAGGAISGGFSSLLVDPESAASGALFGAAMPAAALAARVLPKHVLGVTTGTSAETIGAAFNAGKSKSKEFLENMRGDAPIDKVVNAAKEGVLKLKDDVPVNFSKIESELEHVLAGSPLEGILVHEKPGKAFDKITKKITEWKGGDPLKHHTIKGMDELMRSITILAEDIPSKKKAMQAVANEFIAKAKGIIPEQVPEYLKNASQNLDDVKRSLSSGGNNAEAVKKIQVLLKTNRATGGDKLLSPAQLMSQKQGSDLVAAIAGQGLKSWKSNSQAGDLLQKANVFMPLLTAGTMPPAAVLQLLAAGVFSPRLVGEGAFLAGRAANRGAKALNGLLSNPETQQAVTDGFFRSLPVMPANNPLYER